MKKRKIVLWFAILLWMVMIFRFSAQDGDASSRLSGGFLRNCILWMMPDSMSADTIDLLEYAVRKVAHFSEYAVFGILVFAQIKTYGILRREKYRIFAAILVVFLYASTDEIHQLFVPGRSGRFTDVLIDTLGGTVGILIFAAIVHLIRKEILQWENGKKISGK